MKILALVTEAYGGCGGIAQSNRDLFEALAGADGRNQVFVLPRNVSNPTQPLPSGVAQARAVHGKLSYAFSAASEFFRRGPFDLIFCGHLFMAPLAFSLARIKKTPYWIHIHGIEAWGKPSFLIQRAAERAWRVTAVSRYTRSKFLTWADVSPEKVKVLPDTVDERFKPGSKPGHFLSRYGLEGKKIVLTVGRLSSKERYKGHERVILALPQLLEREAGLVYVIAGEGDDCARLEELSMRLKVEDHVRFIGRVSDEELPDVYRMADLFVMPSRGEGFGIVFLEALSSGVPVIGGNLDGSVDALSEGRSGRLVEPSDPAELCRAIAENLDSEKAGTSGVEVFSKRNFKRHVDRLIQNIFEGSFSSAA